MDIPYKGANGIFKRIFMKVSHFHANLIKWVELHKVCSKGCDWQKLNVAGDGLALNRWQAITWTKDVPVNWVYVSVTGPQWVKTMKISISVSWSRLFCCCGSTASITCTWVLTSQCYIAIHSNEVFQRYPWTTKINRLVQKCHFYCLCTRVVSFAQSHWNGNQLFQH